ncbi:MAG: hypothetical protein KDA24_12465 [Deltaproteobacteria bacterium]|nr:hypothetical protein [Deltaproteobacteria bacterium]
MKRITQLALVTVASTALAIPAFAGKGAIQASAVIAPVSTAALLAKKDAAEAKKAEYIAAKRDLKEARKAKRAENKALWTAAEFDESAIRAAAVERDAERQARRAERLEARIAAFAAMTPEERVTAFEESPKDGRMGKGKRRGKGKRNHARRGGGEDGQGKFAGGRRGKRGHGERGHGDGDCDKDD